MSENKSEISLEEKIDYIYARMKKQQKLELVWTILKWWTRLFLVLSLLYFFFVKLPVLKDEIVDSITPEVPTFDVESISNSDVLNTIKSRFSDFVSEEEKQTSQEKGTTHNIKY